MDDPITTQILKQFREMATQAPNSGTDQQRDERNFGFAAVLHAAINEVSRSQQDALQLDEQLSHGNENSLQDVLNSLRKASISYQSMTTARGNLISAYQAILEN